jgi:predicted dehydrogenase
MTELRIGLIGAGWMGKTHAMCYRAAPLAFGGKPAVPVLEVLADVNEEIAARARSASASRSRRRRAPRSRRTSCSA